MLIELFATFAPPAIGVLGAIFAGGRHTWRWLTRNRLATALDQRDSRHATANRLAAAGEGEWAAAERRRGDDALHTVIAGFESYRGKWGLLIVLVDALFFASYLAMLAAATATLFGQRPSELALLAVYAAVVTLAIPATTLHVVQARRIAHRVVQRRRSFAHRSPASTAAGSRGVNPDRSAAESASSAECLTS